MTNIAPRFLPLALCFFSIFMGHWGLSAQGIQFEHLSWSEVLAKSKAEGKPIFLDAVTSWCGPCKMMSKEVFTDSAAGRFFNANFLNIKLDMERGDGIEVSSKYRVWVYPTLIFVDSTGALLHRSAGFHNPQQLIALAKTALDPSQNLAGMERRRPFRRKKMGRQEDI